MNEKLQKIQGNEDKLEQTDEEFVYKKAVKRATESPSIKQLDDEISNIQAKLDKLDSDNRETYQSLIELKEMH